MFRALEPLHGIAVMKRKRGINDLKRLTNGPCRWTQGFGIDKRFLGKDIASDDIFVAYNRSKRKNLDIVQAKRVGIDYATKSKDLPLRFYINKNPFVSKK